MLLSFLGIAVTGQAQTAPGNVGTNLQLWLKANDAARTGTAVQGGAVEAWETSNFGPAGAGVPSNHAVAGTAADANSPKLQLNAFNFNPGVFYDGVDDFHDTTYGFNANWTYFLVGKMEGTDNQRLAGSVTGNVIFGWWANKEDVLFLDNVPPWHGAGFGQTATTNPKLYMTRRNGTNVKFSQSGVQLQTGTAAGGRGDGGNFGSRNHTHTHTHKQRLPGSAYGRTSNAGHDVCTGMIHIIVGYGM